MVPVFSTRFECGSSLLHSFRVWFQSSPLVSSVVLRTVKNLISISAVLTFQKLKLCSMSTSPNHAVNTYISKITLETSGEDAKLHSKRVEKMQNYTRNERRRCKTTPETRVEDVKLHSKRVEKTYLGRNFTVRIGRTARGGNYGTAISMVTEEEIDLLAVIVWKLTVVLDYYEAMETYSRIVLLRSYGNLQSYCDSRRSMTLKLSTKKY